MLFFLEKCAEKLVNSTAPTTISWSLQLERILFDPFEVGTAYSNNWLKKPHIKMQ